MPPITVVEKMDRNGNRLTLETECLRSGTLPSIAYGFKRCSQKHKVGPQEKFCNHHPLCLPTDVPPPLKVTVTLTLFPSVTVAEETEPLAARAVGTLFPRTHAVCRI